MKKFILLFAIVFSSNVAFAATFIPSSPQTIGTPVSIDCDSILPSDSVVGYRAGNKVTSIISCNPGETKNLGIEGAVETYQIALITYANLVDCYVGSSSCNELSEIQADPGFDSYQTYVITDLPPIGHPYPGGNGIDTGGTVGTTFISGALTEYGDNILIIIGAILLVACGMLVFASGWNLIKKSTK